MTLHSPYDGSQHAAGILVHGAGGKARRHEHVGHGVGLPLANLENQQSLRPQE